MAKKTPKGTPASSSRIRHSRKIKSVRIYPLKGKLSEEHSDEIIRSFEGRPTTKEESSTFRKFIKDPYPQARLNDFEIARQKGSHIIMRRGAS